jgi:Strictosidine synthase
VIAVIRDFLVRDLADRFLGRGEASITVPPFDGALKPNRLLEEAEVFAELAEPEDLATDGKALFIADGNRLWRHADHELAQIATFEQPVTALCCLPGGALAIALNGTEIRIVGGAHDGRSWREAGGKRLNAVNALSVSPAGKLLATDGSRTQPYERWCHDLMERGQSGRVLLLDPSGSDARVLAEGLGYAFGVCAAGDDILVSESWRHRVVSLKSQPPTPVLASLPAYPSRLAPASDGGFWLTAFTARTQLVEFVLRESAYRRRMMKEIEPRYWVAPRLSSDNTFLEPLQGAHIKTMGILKPWAPPKSYGLVMRISLEGLPLYSVHSRADGNNHGVVAAVECGHDLFVLAKGRRRILRLPVAAIEESLRP